VSLVARGLQFTDAVFQRRVGQIGDAILDRVVAALEFGFRLGRALGQFGNMRRSALRALFPAMEDGRQDLLETLGLQETILDVLGYQAFVKQIR
jgi:hypothetical protein